MKKLLLIVIFTLGLIPLSIVFGQSMTFPKWIKGAWHNSYESNTENFESWCKFRFKLTPRTVSN
jgi:hypothetical protein